MANMTSARASSVRNELAVTFWGGHRKGPIGGDWGSGGCRRVRKVSLQLHEAREN